jgi:hypothetical protein
MLFVERIVFITKPLLPIEPEMFPRSERKKFITCSGCRSSCLHRDMKLIMAVFLVPIFYTLGGLSIIFVFSAKSGLFLVRVYVILFSKSLYLVSLRFAIYAYLFSYYFAFYFSTFFFYLFSFFFFEKSIVSIY